MVTRNFIDKLKRYFWYSREETIHYILAVVVLSLVYSWTEWGADKFDAATGLKNYLIAIILVGITVFVHHSGQRMMALKLGFRAEQKTWWYGLIGSLLIAVVTNGAVKFLAATATLTYLLPIHRLGAFRYGPNLSTISKIVIMGPLFNIFFSAIIKTMEWLGMLSPYIGEKLFVLNLTYAAWNLLPIPPLDGSKIFYASRLTYAFIFTTIASYVAMVYYFNFYSYIVALLIGCLGWLLFYIMFESKW